MVSIFEARVRREQEAAKGATLGDYLRTGAASVLDVAGSLPAVTSYAASLSDDPMARDIQSVSDLMSQGLFQLGDDIRGANTPAAQRIMSAAVGSDEFWAHKGDWFGLNIANTAAPMVAGVAAALVAGPTAGMIINQGLAGIQSAGMTYNDMVKDFDNQDLSTNKLYLSLIDEGNSPQEALRKFKQIAIGLKPIGLGVITAMLARYSAGGQVISKLERSALNEVRPGIIRRVATGFGEAGIEEGAQNTLEDATSQSGRVDTGLQKEYDVGKLGEAAASGFAIGGALGGAAGVLPHRGALPVDEPVDEDVAASLAPPAATTATAATAAPAAPAASAAPAEPPTSGATTARPAPPPTTARAPTKPAATPTPPVPADIAAAITAKTKPIAAAPEAAAPPTSGVTNFKKLLPEGIKSFTDITEGAPAAAAPPAPKPKPRVAPSTSTPVADNAAVLTEGGTQAASEVAPAVGNEIATPEVIAQAKEVMQKTRKTGTAILQQELNLDFGQAAAVWQKLLDDGFIKQVGRRYELAGVGETTPAAQPEVQAQAQGLVPPEPTVTSEVNQPETPTETVTASVEPAKPKRTRKQTAVAPPAEEAAAPAKPIDPRVRALLDASEDELGALKLKPQHIAELDALGAEDKAYSKLMSWGAREGLKKGQTWREKIVDMVERHVARERAKAAAPAKPTIVATPTAKKLVAKGKARTTEKVVKKGAKGRAIVAKAKLRGPKVRPVEEEVAAVEPAAVEKPKSKRKPKSIQPQPGLYVRERTTPEPAKPAPSERTPAVTSEYDQGEHFTGKTYKEAEQKLLKTYEPEGRETVARTITRGYEVDGKFSPIHEVADTEGTAAENKRRTEQNISTMLHKRRKFVADQAEAAGVEPGPEPKKRETNQSMNARRNKVKGLSLEIFNRYPPDGKETLDEKKQRLAAIASEMVAAEKEQHARGGHWNMFTFGRRASDLRGGAHGWLVRAFRLNDVWSSGKKPAADIVDTIFQDEALTRAAIEAGDEDFNPVLERSRAEAGTYNAKRSTGSDDELSAELADLGMSDEDMQRLESDAEAHQAETGETIGVPFSRAFQEESKKPRLPPKAPSINDSIREAPKLKEGVTVPRIPQNLNAVKSALKRLRDRLRSENKPIPLWLQTKSDKPLTAKQKATRNAAIAEEIHKGIDAQREAEFQAWLETETEYASRKQLTPEEIAARKAKRIAAHETASKITAAETRAASKRLAEAKRRARIAQIEARETPGGRAKTFAKAQRAKFAGITPQKGGGGLVNMVAAGATEADPHPATIQGQKVNITHARGTERNGQELKAHYGEFPKIDGVDGQRLDVYVGHDPNSETVFVIRQMKKGKRANSKPVFDENKVMLGFASEEDAVAAYRGSVPDVFGEPTIEAMPVEDFNEWKKDPKNTGTGDNLDEAQEAIEASEKAQKPRGQGTSIYDRPFTPKVNQSQLLERATRSVRSARTEQAAADIAREDSQENTVTAEDVGIDQELAAVERRAELGQVEETTDAAETPDVVAKKTPISKEEAKVRREGGIAEGWLQSPYDNSGRTFAEIKHNTDVRGLLAKINFGEVAEDVRGRKSALKFLENRLRKAIGDMKVYVVSDADLNHFLGEKYEATNETKTHIDMYDGLFMPENISIDGDPYIIINERLFEQGTQRLAESALHEIIHGVTYTAIERDPKLRRQLETLMGAVMRHHGIIDPKLHYGFGDAYEFIAEGMTNPVFQELLAGTPLSKQMARELGIKQGTLGIKQGTLLNGWHYFLNALAKAIKFPLHDLSVLHAIVHVTDHLSGVDTAAVRLNDTTPPVVAKISPREIAARAGREIHDYYSSAGKQEQMSSPHLIKLSGLDRLARAADRFWQSKKNPIRTIYRLLTNIGEQTALNEKASEKLLTQMVASQRKAGREVWNTFAEMINDATKFNVFPNLTMAEQTHLGKDPVNKPTLKAVQARKKHAAVSAIYNRLPEHLQNLMQELFKYTANMQRIMSHLLVHNMLVEGLRGEVDPKDIDDPLVARILNREITEDDRKFIGNDELLQRIVRSKELYQTSGPYFPLMRRGDWVVRAKLKVPPPAAHLNGVLKEGTDNVYEFYGKNARKRAMEYAEAQVEKAWVSGRTVDEKTGESWEVMEDGSEMPGTRKKLTLKDPDTVRVFRTEVQNDHFDLFESENDARREAHDLETDKDIVPGSVKGVQNRRLGPGDRGVDFLASDLTGLMSALEKRQGFKDMHPLMQRELRMAAQEFGLQMMGSTRVHKRRIARRSVSGESLDITRGFSDYSRSVASYTARMEFAQEMNAALREMEDSIDAGHRAGAKGRRAIANEVKHRIDIGNGFEQGNKWYSPVVQRLMTTSFIARLASPMYTMMDLLQVGMVAAGVIAGRHGVGRTTRAITKAYKDIGAGSVLAKGVKETWRKTVDPNSETETFVEAISKRLKPREREVLRYISIRAGLEVNKLLRSRNPSGTLAGGALAKGDTALTIMEGIARQMPSAAEAINRAVVLLSSYRLEYERNGGDHEAALQYADDTNNKTNFNYSEINAPPVFNHPLMKIPFQFKRFGHGMYQLLGEEIGRAIRNENPDDRAEALKSLAYVLATHTLMAGALGLPTEIPKAIVLGLFAMGITGFNWQDVENAERALAADLLGKDVGEVVTRGITRALPFGLAFDISQRVGMADMFLGREPNSGDPQDIKTWVEDMLVGAPGAMLFDFQKGARALVEGDFATAGENMIPVKALRDLVKAYDTGMYGKKTASGRPTFDPYSFSEMFIRALGATPEREAENQEMKAQFYSQQAYINKQRGKLEQQWADASTAERIRMRGAIERFNRDKPEEAQLSARKLDTAARRRQTDVKNMQGGVSTNKANRFVLEEAQGVYNAPR